MSLRAKQSLFCRLYASLITWVFTHPRWELTLGEGYNMQGAGHMKGSLHYRKLAADLNLFVDGEYMTQDCPEWRQIGAYWKTLHPLCRWGGDFSSVDLNHVSLAHDGKA